MGVWVQIPACYLTLSTKVQDKCLSKDSIYLWANCQDHVILLDDCNVTAFDLVNK